MSMSALAAMPRFDPLANYFASILGTPGMIARQNSEERLDSPVKTALLLLLFRRIRAGVIQPLVNRLLENA